MARTSSMQREINWPVSNGRGSKRHILHMVVQPVAQVVTDMRGHPLRKITLEEREQRGEQPQAEQNQRRADQEIRLALQQPSSITDRMIRGTTSDKAVMPASSSRLSSFARDKA